MKQNSILLIFTFFLAFQSLNAQPNQNSPLGINIPWQRSWEPGFAFVDAMKFSRPWTSQRPGFPWGQGGPLNLDSLGYVISLDTAIGQYVQTIVFESTFARPSGTYTLLYDGDGIFDFQGDVSGFTPTGPGRMEVEVVPGNNGIRLFIYATDTSGTGNYLRNIRLIMPGHEATYLSQPFYPDFLDRWKNFKVFRYMDWLETNANPSQTWADRTTPNHQTQFRDEGASLEYLIQISNILQADAWVCLPHLADDNYMAQFAQMLKDSLDPNLKVYVEYSNEVWNSNFLQAQYAGIQGVAMGLAPITWQARPLFYAHRSKRMFQIFDSVFNDTSRLVKVLAWQNFNEGGSATVMDYDSVYQLADAFAIAPYFGGGMGNPATQNEIVALSEEELLNRLQHELTTNMLGIESQVANAGARGLKLIAYEGGQHLAGGGSAQNNQAMTNFFTSVNRNPRMQDLYLEYLERWKCAGGEMFCLFLGMGDYSQYGSWGLLEHYDEIPMTKPKYAAAMQFIELNSPPWWENPIVPDSAQVGIKIIDFQGDSIPAGTNLNRTYLNQTDSNGVITGHIIPFNMDTPMFNDQGYNQAIFYGGFVSDYTPDTAAAPRFELRDFQNDIYSRIGVSQGDPSHIHKLILWKKDQFLNGQNLATNVSVGGIDVNLPRIHWGGELRFVIRNGNDYYISDFLIQTDGFHEFRNFNNSQKPQKRWMPFNPQTMDFNVYPVHHHTAVKFDDVTEVGFLYSSTRDGYSHFFELQDFAVYTLNNQEFTATISQAETQTDPDTLNDPVRFLVQFSQAAVGFDSTDVSLSGTALPQNVSVQEIAPFDSTRFEISVSGMCFQGSVIANIDSGVCHNLMNIPNRKATTLDNIVQYNIPNPPSVQLEQATFQTDPDLMPPVYFTAIFSNPITSFDGSDVVLSGTAGANTAVVSEIAPMNGTTFQIEVSGMNADGTVIANIPAQTVKDTIGAFNLASESIDNQIDFYTTNPPLVTINQSPSQPDPAYDLAINFVASFNQSVSGFEASDVILSGTAGANMVQITEIAPFNSTNFRVTVDGMSQEGSVIAQIDAGVAQNNLGRTNLISTSTDNQVEFKLYPHQGTIVNFQGVNVPDGVITNRFPELAADSMSRSFSFNMDSVIFTTGESQSEFYGGVYMDFMGGIDLNSQFILRTNDSGFAPNRLYSYSAGNSMQPTAINYLFMWKKEQFLNNFSEVQVAFDDDTLNSRLAVNIPVGINLQIRFIIRNNGVYYISEYEGNNLGLNELKGFNNSNLPDKGWGIFNLDSANYTIPNPLPSFQAVDFQDVTEVGVVFRSSRTGFNNQIMWDGFTVDGISHFPDSVPTQIVPAEMQSVSANRETADNLWTHYWNDNNTSDLGDDVMLLSLQKNGQDIGSIGDGTFQLQVHATAGAGSNQGALIMAPYVSQYVGNFYVMNRFWEVFPTNQPIDSVGLRFYYNNQDLADVNGSLLNPINHRDLIFYKIDAGGNPDPSQGHGTTTAAQYHDFENDSLNSSTEKWRYETWNSAHFAECFVNSFSGGGGGSVLLTPPLAIDLFDFEAQKQANSVLLKWKTGDISNLSHFEIEHSFSGNYFQSIAQQNILPDAELPYQFLDKQPIAGKNYYRIKAVELDGAISYSEIRMIEFKNQNWVSIYPNPASNELKINALDQKSKNIKLFSSDGKLILKQEMKQSKNLNISNLSAGIYFIQIENTDFIFYEKLLILR